MNKNYLPSCILYYNEIDIRLNWTQWQLISFKGNNVIHSPFQYSLINNLRYLKDVEF